MKWSVVGLLLVIALYTNARTLTPVDVPDPPKSVPASVTATKDTEEVGVAKIGVPQTHVAKSKMPSLKRALTGTCEDACNFGLERPGCKCLHDSPTKLCKLACDFTDGGSDCECTVISRVNQDGMHEIRTVIADKIVLTIIRPSIEDIRDEMSTVKVPTTTLSPIEEFCKEACTEGYGGPECDCADHPIG